MYFKHTCRAKDITKDRLREEEIMKNNHNIIFYRKPFNEVVPV